MRALQDRMPGSPAMVQFELGTQQQEHRSRSESTGGTYSFRVGSQFESKLIPVFFNSDSKSRVDPSPECIVDFIHFGSVREDKRLNRAQRESL